MSNAKKDEPGAQLSRLLDIMATLRDPDGGCPWDLKQTMASLTRYTIEEAYEVADAIHHGEPASIRDELGDLLFQVVFYARIAQESGQFAFSDVCEAISDKLVRRHPHVFGNESQYMPGDEALSAQWETIKAAERAEKTTTATPGFFDNIPSGLPSLTYAYKLQKACAKVGFDWPETTPVLAKVREEVDEISDEINAEQINEAAVEEEIGDALFAMVNLARHCNIDPDTALRKASYKFAGRFEQVEKLAGNEALETMSLAQMEALWQQVKKQRATTSR